MVTHGKLRHLREADHIVKSYFLQATNTRLFQQEAGSLEPASCVLVIELEHLVECSFDHLRYCSVRFPLRQGDPQLPSSLGAGQLLKDHKASSQKFEFRLSVLPQSCDFLL